jgi:diguanylate cyclase (GGDEF)-like protein
MCIIFIAYPPVSFMASATENKDTKLLPIMVVLISLNLVANMLLSGFGIFDPHDLLILSHINIIVAMIMVVFLMVKAIRRKSINKLFVRLSLIGMLAALLGVTTDMLRFWTDKTGAYGSSPYTKTGVLIFIVLEGAYLIKERGRLAVERERAELMEKMAYTDGLTELANRAAFHEKEGIISEKRQPCFIVQLDINYLKTVNDEYGHAEGDKHIIAAADCINNSFSGVGECYRTGGDEFIVIAVNSKDEDIKRSLEKLERAAEKYNQKEIPPVPLELAYGYAEFDPNKDNLENAEKLADERMYAKKRRMKQAK